VTGMEITLRDVYDAQQAGRSEVSALAGKVEVLTSTVALQLAAGNTRMEDHERRLRAAELAPKVNRAELDRVAGRVASLESSRAKLTGIWMTLSVTAGAGAALAEHLLTGH
jgi:hypothetical protein